METQMPKDVQVQTAKWKRIGDILMDSGLITREQMKAALQKQAVTGKRLGTLLIDLGFISEENMVGALSRQLGVPSVDLKKITVSDEVLELLPFSFFLKHEILPLEKNGDVLKVAMVNPLDRSAIDEIGFMIGCAVQPLVTTSSALQRFLKNRLASDEGMLPDMDEPVEIMKDQITEPDMIRVKKTAESRSVAGTLGKILWDAVKSGAASIHINPRRKDALLRYRIDGFLQHETTVSLQTHEALLYRLKQMAGMVPDMIRGIQQGTAQVRADARTIDLRVSTLPTLHGEKVVIRLLDKSRKMRTFESLGMHPRDLSTCYTLLAGSPGLVLLSGPVGSGITTTLYAILHYLRSEQNNIITLEDPVEYEIPGISQVQITPGTGISFEDGIRAALNQDPDIMMVSDIRNPEAALLLFEAALRGHRVFSSIHANDAVSALGRIIRMDTPACLAASALSGIIAQRLVRRNCPHCLEKYIPEPRVLAGLRIDMKEISKMHFYRGRGCKQCSDTGYSGQTGIYEILPFDPEIRDMVFRKAASQEIFRLAREKGMTTMEENGLYLVLNKITTLEELLRVIPSDGIVSRRKGPWEEEIISLYDDAVYVL